LKLKTKKLKKNSAFFSKLQLVKEIVFSRTDLEKKIQHIFWKRKKKITILPFKRKLPKISQFFQQK